MRPQHIFSIKRENINILVLKKSALTIEFWIVFTLRTACCCSIHAVLSRWPHWCIRFQNITIARNSGAEIQLIAIGTIRSKQHKKRVIPSNYA